MSCVSSPLIGSEILGQLFTTLTDGHMYSCHNWKNLPQQVQTQWSAKPSTFSGSFSAFLKSTTNFEDLKKKNHLHSLCISEVIVQKNVITWMHQNPCFRTPFGNQRVTRSKSLLKSAKQYFCANIPLISKKFSCVSCLLVESEILGALFNTLTSDHKYSCHNSKKLREQVQTELFSKPWTFSANFIAFSKST